MVLRAIRACWHNKRFYKPGMVFLPEGENDKPPRHFVPEPEFSPKAVVEAARGEKLKRVAVKAQKAAEAGGPTGGAVKQT